MTRQLHGLAASLALGVLTSAPAWSYDLPAVNLGFTSFLDGAPPSGPGWYVQQYVQLYRNARLKDDSGDNRSLPTGAGSLRKASVDANIGLTQLVYQSDQTLLLGGKWGMNLMLPYASFDLDPDDGPIRTNSGNLGDLLAGPFLQWDPIMGPNGPRFMNRIELQMIFPTGAYDADDAINPGSKVDMPVCQSDFMATIADIVGAELPDNAAEDSHSLLPLISENASGEYQSDRAVIHHSSSGYFAIRKGKWKLNMFRGSGGSLVPRFIEPKEGEAPYELYNMETDPGETTNLYFEHPEIVNELKTEISKIIKTGRSTAGTPQEYVKDNWKQVTWMEL